jgi:CHAT domain-containing protein
MTDPEDGADEQLGLASGFVFAGAPGVLCSLWVIEEPRRPCSYAATTTTS